jgi:hypothetical protein
MCFRAPNILTLAYEKMNRQKYTSFPATFRGNSNTTSKSITLRKKSDEKIQFSVSDLVRYDQSYYELTDTQLVKKFNIFYETQRFVKTFRRDSPGPYPKQNQSSPPHAVSIISISIFSSHYLWHIHHLVCLLLWAHDLCDTYLFVQNAWLQKLSLYRTKAVEWKSWLQNILFHYFKPSPVRSIHWQVFVSLQNCGVFPSWVYYGGNCAHVYDINSYNRQVESWWNISSDNIHKENTNWNLKSLATQYSKQAEVGRYSCIIY